MRMCAISAQVALLAGSQPRSRHMDGVCIGPSKCRLPDWLAASPSLVILSLLAYGTCICAFLTQVADLENRKDDEHLDRVSLMTLHTSKVCTCVHVHMKAVQV